MCIKILKSKKNYGYGFTLVEALVAISILMIAIAGPMTLAQKGLSTATLSKDQMIASFLAQDGIEAVKNMRDQIALSKTSGDWLTGTLLDNCLCDDNEKICNFDSPTAVFCKIDSTASQWNSNSVKRDDPVNPSKLKISYDSNLKFLKYDYHDVDGEAFCSNNINAINPCLSKFTRYINIKKSAATGIASDEAAVNVRVSWNSPLGKQNMEIKNYIYNYSAYLEHL